MFHGGGANTFSTDTKHPVEIQSIPYTNVKGNQTATILSSPSSTATAKLYILISAFPCDHIHTVCQQWKKIPPSSPCHTKTQENYQLEAIKKLIKSKLSQIEEHNSSAEQQIKS